MYLGLYAATGVVVCLERARLLSRTAPMLTLFAFNLLVWGHVVVGLWQICCALEGFTGTLACGVRALSARR